jgi:ElaB/YqjD/DUF883 family membrane-anchored ribosome-binding protein
MTGATGTPPTTPTQKAAGTAQSTAEKTLDTEQPAPEKILEANPPTTTASAPTLTSGSQIETATTIPGTTGNTIIVGSDDSRDQQDRRGQSEGLTETASQYGRDMGRRASEAYEQGRRGVSTAAGQAWDTAQRAAGQVRRQSGRGVSSAQSVLADNPLAAVAVGAAVGVMVGYLIGNMTASTRTTGTRRYDDHDEFSDSDHYPGGYQGSYSSSNRYPDGGPRTDIHRYADRVRYSDGD